MNTISPSILLVIGLTALALFVIVFISASILIMRNRKIIRKYTRIEEEQKA